MRVLYWSDLFWPHVGGAELLSADLIEALRERGHQPLVLTRQDPPGLPDQARVNGVPVRRIPFRTAFVDGDVDRFIAARQEVTRLERRFAPDLVHVVSFGASVLLRLDTATARSAPMLLTLHGEKSLESAGDTLLRRALRSAAWVTGVSASVVARARELVPEIRPRSSVIYNGRKPPGLPPAPLPAEPTLLCLGRLVPRKGFDLAVSAFPSVARRIPGVRLIVAGDGPARPALERQTVRLGVADRVEFRGAVTPDEVPGLINRATAVVIPSRREGLPLVALEAGLMARPVVATRVDGLPELVEDRETGLLVDPDDGGALADALALLLADRGAAVRMGQQARRRVLGVFGWEQCVSAYESLYRQLTLGARGESADRIIAAGPRAATGG